MEVPLISLVHRTVFVHIPKCGGESVETAIIADLGMVREKVRPLFLLIGKPHPRYVGEHHRLTHLRASEYPDNYLPREVFFEFYRFAIVRNPFARVESMFWFKNLSSIMSFEDFVTKKLGSWSLRRPFYTPQAKYLVDAEGALLVNDLFRLEDIAKAWSNIQARTGVKAELPHVNKSKRSHALDWTDEMRRVVEAAYASDFDLLGYDRHQPAS